MALTTLENTRWNIHQFPSVISGNRNQDLNINFIANGKLFTKIYFWYYRADNWSIRIYDNSGSQVEIYWAVNGNPVNESYRNITIIGGEAATWSNLITWFENNADEVPPDYYVGGGDLKLIADTIRAKGGTSAQLSFPQGFIDAINAL